MTKQEIVSLIDLTRLGDNDTSNDIINLANKAKNNLGQVAALCVYKEFIQIVKDKLGQDFKVATVTNFPKGNSDLKIVLDETKQALENGADEIDLVIDFNDYIKNGKSDKSCELISESKKLCKDKTLKVIIESGELKSEELIRKVSSDAIENGADFIKTSTGKVSIGATLDACNIMIDEIVKSGKKVGFKASGGIRTYEEALKYTKMAQDKISKDFVNNESFRFGVSGLLDNLLTNTKVDKNAY